MKVYARSTVVPCSDTDAFDVIERIGGNTGYYYGDWLWRARARIDRLLGGPGLLPGRRDPDHLVVGDEVNCWEVAEYEPNSLLSLATRMKMPGDGWLQFEVEDLGGDTRIHLTVRFRPRGLPDNSIGTPSTPFTWSSGRACCGRSPAMPQLGR